MLLKIKMEKVYILLADQGPEIQNGIFSYFKERYNLLLLMPYLLTDLFQEPFLSSNLAIIDSKFLGNQAFVALKALKICNPTLPIIFTSSKDEYELGLNIYKLGVKGYFKKPYLIYDIIKSIEHILSKK